MALSACTSECSPPSPTQGDEVSALHIVIDGSVQGRGMSLPEGPRLSSTFSSYNDQHTSPKDTRASCNDRRSFFSESKSFRSDKSEDGEPSFYVSNLACSSTSSPDLHVKRSLEWEESARAPSTPPFRSVSASALGKTVIFAQKLCSKRVCKKEAGGRETLHDAESVWTIAPGEWFGEASLLFP